jgi:hypothetical protein
MGTRQLLRAVQIVSSNRETPRQRRKQSRWDVSFNAIGVPDPHKLLLVSGSQNRFIRVELAATLTRPEVEELIASAIKQAEGPLRGKGKGKLVIRSISKKQKPRRKALD